MPTSQRDEENPGEDVNPNTRHSNPPTSPPPMDRIRGFFGWKESACDDLSKKISADELHKIDPLVPTDEPLAIFRRLAGIDSSAAHTENKELHLYRPAPNQGIYRHVVIEENAARRKYVIFSRLINGCLGLQIIVAAALTALGAGDGPHAVVTIFGAINTVIAGFLTYLKGSGLPSRPKFFQNEWSKLREHIEQRERDFGCKSCKLEVDEEVEKVEEMYKEIRAMIEASTPDGYTSAARAGDKKRLDRSHAIEQPDRESTRIEGP